MKQIKANKKNIAKYKLTGSIGCPYCGSNDTSILNESEDNTECYCGHNLSPCRYCEKYYVWICNCCLKEFMFEIDPKG